MDSGGFVKIIIRNLFKKNKILKLRNPEFLMKLKLPKLGKLRYEKLAVTSQFDLTGSYDVIICNSVF